MAAGKCALLDAIERAVYRACGIVLVLPLIVFLAPAVLAQSDPCLRRVEAVSVVDEHGGPVGGLSAGDFEASFHRKPVRIISATQNSSAVPMILLVDMSGSMASLPEWNIYKQAAEYALNQMPPGASIQVVTFVQRPKLVSGPTTDRTALKQNLEKVFLKHDQARGTTALWDTLAAESKAFAAPRDGAAIFVLTDGDDNASRSTRYGAQREMIEQGVRVFSFSVINPIRGMQDDYRWFTDFARDTGGFGVNAEGLPNAVDEKGNLNEIGKWELRSEIAQIFEFYRLQIELPERPRAGAGWNLKLAPSRKHLVIEWPRELASCSGEQGVAIQ